MQGKVGEPGGGQRQKKKKEKGFPDMPVEIITEGWNANDADHQGDNTRVQW